MKVGDMVLVRPEAWAVMCVWNSELEGTEPTPQPIEKFDERYDTFMLAHPLWWWRECDLILMDQEEKKIPAEEDRVVSLDEHRIRVAEEFNDEQVAYVEVLWGKKTFAFNAAVRNLEDMRRGQDDGALRPPETYHEALHLILHVRALANDMARYFGMEEFVRKSDELPNRNTEKKEGGGS